MPPKYVEIYFKQQNQNSYKCLVCPDTHLKKSNNSWAILLSHLNENHSDWEAQVENVSDGGTLDCFKGMVLVFKFRH